MKILAVCHWGRNRSRVIADHLRTKGYDTDFCGILDETDNKITQERIDWADTVLAVEPRIGDEIRGRFSLDTKKIVSINVDDKTARPGVSGLTGPAWEQYQQETVYPDLIQAVDRLFPSAIDR